MDATIARNRRFLSDLFAGPFRGHAIIMDPEPEPQPFPGDFAVSDRPLADWLPSILRHYEAQLRLLDALGHDAVPTARLGTGTGLFASAFGCPVHIYPDSPAAARPLVFSADEADRLAVPTLETFSGKTVLMMAWIDEAAANALLDMALPDTRFLFNMPAQSLDDARRTYERLRRRCQP